MEDKIELVYVMDPHCGWCYGFGKVILELFEKYQDDPAVSFEVKPGGLFHPPIHIRDGFAADKRPIAKRIEQLSGVRFSEDYFTKILGHGSVLDSEPPARAILSVRELNPDLLVPFTEKLLEMEFIYAKNNSSEEVIMETVRYFSIDEVAFKKLFSSDEMKDKVHKEFQEVQGMATGFPVLYLSHNDQLTKLAGGYAPLDRLLEKINVHVN